MDGLLIKMIILRVAEIINNIITNKIALPLQQVCISSVEKFSDDIVISNIESAIIKELE